MTVGEICTRRVQTIGKDAVLVDAARRMRNFHVGDLIVVEERGGHRVPVGILTDRDIVVSVAAQDLEHFQSLLVGDVVPQRLITARRDDSVPAALKQMRTHGVRRLPILDERGALYGILSLDDILGFLAKELEEVSKIIEREQQHERATRNAV